MGVCEDCPDCIHCAIESLRNVPIDRLQGAHACRSRIEIGGKSRTVRGKGVQLGGKRLLLPICGLPPLHRCRQRIKRERKALAGGLDRTWFAHCDKYSTARGSGGVKIHRNGKQLVDGPYVIPRLGVNLQGRRWSNLACGYRRQWTARATWLSGPPSFH